MTAALPPIPAHLPAWQAGHLAWLASKGLPTRYAAPEGAGPKRADLRDADLRGADLRGADLRWAMLRDAVLSEADLTDANLTGAVLSGAVLSDAYLRGTDLYGAVGVASIGPVGRYGRIIYAVAHDDGPMVQAGCWWGSVPDTITRIEADYANDPAARDRYVAAVRAVAALVTP
jgi:hypothetical protein